MIWEVSDISYKLKDRIGLIIKFSNDVNLLSKEINALKACRKKQKDRFGKNFRFLIPECKAFGMVKIMNVHNSPDLYMGYLIMKRYESSEDNFTKLKKHTCVLLDIVY
jgi:hypothetical protein